jgi:hypothetical protein
MARFEDWVNITKEMAVRLLRLGCDIRDGVTDEYDYETYLRLVSDAYDINEDDLEILLDNASEDWE